MSEPDRRLTLWFILIRSISERMAWQPCPAKPLSGREQLR
ncbi:MAG: hypothetical protein OJF48_002709 [Afipia sp.]|nr:MAG: hypothetical protein OJF48_002709 [Afipia sp.]